MDGYLAINHVPVGPLRAGRFRAIGDLWLTDIRAMVKAGREYGFGVSFAVPVVEDVVAHGGSFTVTEVDVMEEGIVVHELPFVNSLRGLIANSGQIRRSVAAAAKGSAVAQMDYGGHPTGLGQIVWDTRSVADTARIWIFDGADPFDRLELHAESQRNPLRRIVWRCHNARFGRFCNRVLSEADLVFAHNESVVTRFRTHWSPETCHLFPRSFVTSDIISDASEASVRALSRSPSDPFRIVVLCRQIRIKGTDRVIRAVYKARALGIDIQLDVYGDGKDLELFRDLAADLGLGSSVEFKGVIPYGPKLFEVIRHANAIAVTNLTSEISRNVMLTLAIGTPLISYFNAGTKDLLNCENSVVVSPDSNDALVNAMISLQKAPGLCAKLAVNGIEVAKTNTLDATHRRRMELARQVVGRRRPVPAR